ncbi:tail fiber [Pelagibacter phage Hroenn EXVC015P]|nr:tail fiber [Pelagibacter phage Bylgja EXVC010P]QLF88309.1 tail fiber [Pelagibacter phage Himinglaeva EXVC011P]QLF88396.1 tail fiber [Pelagibacter phage Hroenn EXVC015P]QLF88607.1 tail fiber [Pelagibacter phage Unn EXVC019P]
MANSFVRYTGNGSTTAYSISYTYRDAADLIVSINGVATTSYSLNAAGTTLTFDTAPANASSIEIRRKTSQTTRLTDYAAGSVLTENDLDTDSTQAFFMGQEAIDDANDVIKISSTDFQYNAGNKQIRNVANPTSNQDVATKNYLENTFLTTANKTALTTINANIANIIAVNNNATNINSAVSNSTNINLVANNIGSVNVVATDIAKVIEVANDLQEAVSEVETVADDLNEATSEIDTVAVNIANVNLVGNSISNVNALAPKVTELGLLGTSAVVTDLGILGTSANVTAMGHLGTSANVTAMGLLGTSAVVTDMGLLGTSANVTAMGLLGNSTVISNISTVSSKNTEIGLLGTSANVTAMGNLGTSANVTAMGLLGTSSVVTDMGILGTSSNVSNMSTLAGISGLSTLASNNANITAVAGKVTEIGLLGTSANVSNMATLGTSTNVSNMSTLAGITNLNNLANAHASVTSVANNLASVNSFANTYLGASGSAPTQDPDGSALDLGDLYFDTGSNQLKVYSSTGWVNAGSSVNGTSDRFKYTVSGTPTTISGNDDNSNSLSYDAGFIDVFLNGIKMVNGTDVTVTSGNSVVFASALTNGDVVDIITFGTFNIASMNASNLSSGTVPDARITGAYTGITNLTMSGDLNVASNVLFVDASASTVGLGTNSPNHKLELLGGSPAISIKSNNTTNGSSNILFGDTNDDDIGKIFYEHGTNSFRFLTNASERMRIEANGLVRIKNTSHTNSLITNNHNLVIGNESSSAHGLAILSPTNENGYISFFDSGNSGSFRGTLNYNHNDDSLRTYVNGSERIRINSSGNLLVGKTSTTRTVAGAELRPDGFIRGTKNSAHSIDAVRTTDDGDVIRLYKDNNIAGVLGTQNWGIGTSSPTEALEVTGNLKINSTGSVMEGISITPASAGSTSLLLNTFNGGVANDRNWAIRNRYNANGRLEIMRSTNNTGDSLTPVMTFERDGDVVVKQNLYVDASGAGIFLGGASTNNKLEDYEEGTWTPVVNAASGFSTGITSTTNAKYTKIGNMVNVRVNFQMGNSSGNLAIEDNVTVTGLPYTASHTEQSQCCAYRYNVNNGVFHVYLSTTSAIFVRCHYVNGSPPRNGGSISLNYTYQTT